MEPVAQLNAALTGRYEIEREIGRGGMATVYLARDVRHDRKVAVKVLNPELGAILGVERFLAEIKVTANLQHPNLLPLFDSGEVAGLLFYVMPFVEGESLRAKLDREKQLPIDDAVRIAVAVASALEYAHARGVIHRDLKPENILLHAGQPVVADFGIALAVSNAGGARVTQTGISLGTPQYMSPEQATGDRAIDGRTDIYSLGAVLYEMLTGEPPHSGTTAQAIISRVLTEIPRSVRATRTSVPVHIDAAVEQALEKLPADRFSSAGLFASALEGHGHVVSSNRRSASSTARAPRRQFSMIAFAMVTLTALVGGALVGRVWFTEPPRATPDRWSIPIDSAPLVFVGEASLGMGLPALALSADARRIVYVGRRGTGTALFLHDVGSFDIRLLAGTEGAFHPFFSPNGNEVAFFAGSRLKKVSISGGSPTTLADVVEPHGGLWTDRDVIVVTDHEGSRLSTIPAASGKLTPIGTRQSGILSPSPIPGSPWLLHSLPSNTGLLAVTSIESGETRYLSRTGPPTASAAGADILYGTRPIYVDGFLVYVAPTEGRLLARRFDARTLEIRGDAFSVLAGIRVEAGGAQTAFGGGAFAYATGGDARTGRLVWGNGERIDTLAIPPGLFGNFEISPKGNRLALTLGTTDGPPELQLYDLGQLNRGPQERWRPPPSTQGVKWAPNERAILLSGSVGYGQPWTQRASLPLGGAVDTLSDNFFSDSFTRDGRSMLGIVVDSTGVDLGQLSVDGGKSTPLRRLPGDQIWASLSPNGDWLAYMSSEFGPWEIWVEPFPGPGPRQKVSIGGREPRWSPSGERLYYRNRNVLFFAPVNRSTGEVGAPRKFISGPFVNVPSYSYAVSQDGNRLLLILGPSDETATHIRVVRDFGAEIRRAEARR